MMDWLSGLALLTVTDWLVLIVAGIIAGWSQLYLKNAFKVYGKERPQGSGTFDFVKRGLTGKEIAKTILQSNGISDVSVGRTSGDWTDHYDPAKKEVNLSSKVYNKDSIAAVSVAAHEVGHALQHHLGYTPLRLRHGLIPLANLGSNLAIPIFLIGFLFSWNMFMNIGIWAFAGALLFQVVTLPVEYNASGRAIKLLRASNMFSGDDIKKAKKVLNAAALTYVAAMSITLLHLLRLIVLRNSRNS